MKLIEIGLIIALIIIGCCLIDESFKLNEHINGDVKNINLHYDLHYSLNQTDNDTMNIHFLNWTHDFTNDKGKISFKASCDNANIPFKDGEQEITFGNIEFEFFVPIKITDIYAITNVSTGKPEHRVDFDYILNGNSTLEFSKDDVFEKFNLQKRNNYLFQPLNETFAGETIVVEFESNFEPDGTFVIQTRSDNRIHTGGGKHSQGNVNFILGNDYVLSELTLSNNIEKVYKSSDTSITLSILFIGKYDEILNKDIIFGLNSVNKKIRDEKELKLILGNIFITSGITLIVETITKIIPYFPSFTLFKHNYDRFIKSRIKGLRNFIVSYLKGLQQVYDRYMKQL